MVAKETDEIKKYRKSFIIYALLGVAGIAAGIYVAKYTDWISGQATGYAYVCSLDAAELFRRYYLEVRYLVVLFLLGFTVFASPAAIAFSLWRGFVSAVGIVRLAGSGAGTAYFVLTACAMASVLVIETAMAAKSSTHAARLRYVAPRAGELIRDPAVRRYFATFAILCALLFAAVVCAFFAPLLPF